MRVAVTGAGGFIGSHLANFFLDRGDEVFYLARNPERMRFGATFFKAELGDPLPENALEGLDLLIHGAHDFSLEDPSKNIDGTTLWMFQAQQAGVKHQIFLSSCSASDHRPSGYGQIKYRLENIMTNLGGTVLRLGLVVGRGGLCGRMVSAVLSYPIIPVFGGNNLKVALIGIDDLTTVISRFHSIPKSSCENIFYRRTLGLNEFLAFVAVAAGRKPVFIPIPLNISKLIFRLAGNFSSAIKQYGKSLAGLEEGMKHERMTSAKFFDILERDPREAILVNLRNHKIGRISH